MLLHSYTKGLLYHYTRKERAIQNIFSGEMTIRLGSMKHTNDLRETDPWFFGLIIKDEENGPSGEEFFEVTQRIDQILKDSCRLVCFSEDAPDLHPERGDLGPQGYAHDRMWAQYADNHTGVCIFFDREKLAQRMKEHFRDRPGLLLHGPVAYISDLPPRANPFYELSWEQIQSIGVEAFAKRHRETFARQLYFTKDLDWASEQEYRYVWIEGDDNREGDAEFVSIKGCVSSVCLGAHFPVSHLSEMKTIKERLGVEFHQILYSYGKLDILPVLVNPPPT